MDDKFWEDLNKYPPLKPKDEIEIAKKAKAGDRQAYETLINSNLRFVVRTAKEYSGQGLELEELIAYGNVGICKAYSKYDPDSGYKFITYAVWWIRQSILQALNDHNHLIKIPHYQRVTKTTIEKAREKLERKFQRTVTYAEVEDEVGKDLKLSTLEAYHIIPLDKSFTEDGESPIKDILEDKGAINPIDFLEHESFMQELDEILEDFTDREKIIIKYYHGIGIIRNLTLEEIGTEFGITRERVRQIKEKVLQKLRHKSRSERLQPYLAILKSEILNDMSSSDEETS